MGGEKSKIRCHHVDDSGKFKGDKYDMNRIEMCSVKGHYKGPFEIRRVC